MNSKCLSEKSFTTLILNISNPHYKLILYLFDPNYEKFEICLNNICMMKINITYLAITHVLL